MTLVLGAIDFLDVTASAVEVERNAASIYDGEKATYGNIVRMGLKIQRLRQEMCIRDRIQSIWRTIRRTISEKKSLSSEKRSTK